MPTFPSRDPEIATLQQQIKDLKREIGLLKQKPRYEDIATQTRYAVPFSRHGAVVGNEQSGNFLIHDFDATIHQLDYTARVPPTVSATWQILVNDTVMYEFEVGVGEDTYSDVSLAINVEEWDRVSLNCTTANSGQETVVVTLYVTATESEEW